MTVWLADCRWSRIGHDDELDDAGDGTVTIAI
jgi:hypothetical protein